MVSKTRFTYNAEVFTKETSVSYYLLGLYITDGNIYLGNSNKKTWAADLKLVDLELLEVIRDLVSPGKPIDKVKNSNCYRFRITNKVIVKWFIDKGCIPNKTKTVKFPIVPKEYLQDFLRGLIDGDGSIGIYKGKSLIRFDSASLDLMD